MCSTCVVCKNVSDVNLPLNTGAGRVFSSGVGIRVLSDGIEQLCQTRLCVCRDLLILIVMIRQLSKQVSVTC